jgi:acid phosphatase (class A)
MTTHARFPVLLAVISFVFAAGTLQAAGPYLGSDAPDAITLLPPPPPAGSPEDVADREMAFRVYSTHTPEQFALGVAEEKLSIFQLTSSVGPWFHAGGFPKTEALFKVVEAELYPIAKRAKLEWKRPRPYIADPARFSVVIEHEEDPSPGYPSSHATRGALYSLLLVELFPEQRDAILAKGREAGWLRVQGGVHTPIDTYAGRTLGQAVAQALLRNAAFQRDLAAAKAEIAAAKP